MPVRLALITVLVFVFGVGVGYAAQKGMDPSLYRSRTNEDAGLTLLKKTLIQAEDGSWERIAVGRVYYLSGRKTEGQAIFDDVLGKEPDPSDLFRVARVYREAGEWPRAKALFDQSLQLNPKDEKGFAEAGAYYLLNGDRATAETLFDRSFKIAPEFWATIAAAGAYLGVQPQE